MLSRLTTALAVMLIALGLAAPIASTDTYTFEPGGSFTGTSLGQITLSDSESTIAVRCEAGLEGGLESEEIEGSPETPLGSVAEVTMEGCSGGTLTPLAGTWELTYIQSLGDPSEVLTGLWFTAEAVDIQASVTILGFRVTCLYAGTIDLQLGLSGSGPYELGLATIAESELTYASGSELCPRSATATGVMAIESETTMEFAQTGGEWRPSRLQFGNQAVLTTSAGQSTAFRNDSGNTRRVTRIFVRANSGLSWDTDDLFVGKEIRDGAANGIEVRVFFTPTLRRLYFPSLTIDLDNGRAYSVNITGRGI